MPIYEYSCRACGVQREMLQKVSEPVLTQCPACGAEAFEKKVSAAGFQLKGSGWYVTDFRGGRKDSGASPDSPAASSSDASSGDGKSSDAAAPAGSGTASGATAPTPPASPVAAS